MIPSIAKVNTEKTLKLILATMGCKQHKSLFELMKMHPNFPSLLSFKYALGKVGVDSTAMKVTLAQLRDELPKPVLVRLTTDTELFLLVVSVDPHFVIVLDSKGSPEIIPVSTFEQAWDGYVFTYNIESTVKENLQ